MHEWIMSNGASLGRATFIVAVMTLLFGLLFDIRAENREIREDLGKAREELGITREVLRNENREARQELRSENREAREELRNEIRENRGAIGRNRDAVDDLRLEVNQGFNRADERTDDFGEESTRRIDATNGRIDDFNKRADDLSGQINSQNRPAIGRARSRRSGRRGLKRLEFRWRPAVPKAIPQKAEFRVRKD